MPQMSRIPRLLPRTKNWDYYEPPDDNVPKIRLHLRTPKNWRIELTTFTSAPAITIPDIILHDANGKIILEAPGRKGTCRPSRHSSQRHCNEIFTKNGITAIPRIQKSRTKNGDYTHGLTGCPSGPYEETIALVRAGRIGSDDISECRPEPRHVRGHCRAVSARRSRPAMGSNVSRHSGKGLGGRRSQSSGNLCHGAKLLAPNMGRLFNPCGAGGVSPRDRYKFCGSLPNHLDEKEQCRGDGTPESLYSGNNNYGEVYGGGVDLVLNKLGPDGAVGDQGYSSERSPEEELPPFLPNYHIFMEFPFITKENVFEVTVEKGSRGLGLSVSGGVDSDEPHPGLLRIKRLFPHQPAWECGALRLGDILLEASGTPLTGLTNYEALEVLRTTPQTVKLLVCRPPQNELPVPQSAGEPPPPPRRDPGLAITSSLPLEISPVANLTPEIYGEFDITLHKINGSLGFTLRKEDESVLGHYVRALVREPAISDGRIRPGDKIVAVNGIDISPLTHEEAVQMLRQCGDSVWLRLYRDSAQTPVSALSPTEPNAPTRRPALRQEAVDMLCDLAVRRLSPGESSSPRRRRLERADPSRASESTASTVDTVKAARPAFLDLDGDSLRRNQFQHGSLDNEPTSLPPLLSSPTGFSTRNPVYQSARDPCPTSSSLLSDQDENDKGFAPAGSLGLLKWKGVVFTPEDEADQTKESTPKTDSNHSEQGQVITVELSKGWNSRLGFSLQSSASGTWISAIYADSVAAKDGRLQTGDRVLMINDERTDGMSTSEVIDLLRKIRGAIAITVLRPGS